jgi:asparagine N-glycosylation enzyme membrane subunit Stt3
MEKPNYDPGVIEEFAARLYARAKTIMLSYGLLGFLIGILMVGALSVKAGREDSNGVFLILAVAIPTLIGVFVGRARGFALRLQAQQALCQVAIEKNTFALRGLMASTQPRT